MPGWFDSSLVSGQPEGVTSQGEAGDNAMRKIAIVGGGQSGLQLALGLLKNNYEVTVFSDRTAEQIFNGRVNLGAVRFRMNIFFDALVPKRGGNGEPQISKHEDRRYGGATRGRVVFGRRAGTAIGFTRCHTALWLPASRNLRRCRGKRCVQ